ncbi:helix-turn-helix domain-containing protein [Escherichia fergusonii]
MKIETFDNVWDAVSDTPEQAENMRIRAELVTIINNWIEQQGFSQAQAASALGVTQPRISELARGKIQIFSIDKLITMMAHAGLHIQRIEVQYPHAAYCYKDRWRQINAAICIT